MAAICAACRQPITKRDRFVIEGTEVFHRHRRCVAAIPNSVATRLQLEITDLRARAEQSDANAAYHQRRGEELGKTLSELRSKLIMAEANLDGTILDRNTWRKDAVDAQDENRRLANQIALLEQQLATARRDRVAAQTAALETAVAALPPPATPERADEDSSKVRFSLLDLD